MIKIFFFIFYILINNLHAESENIFSRVKKSLLKMSNQSVDFFNKHTNLSKDRKFTKKVKTTTKIIEYSIILPPPDTKIFKDQPIDILKQNGNSFINGQNYIVENIIIYENSGYTVGESRDNAIRKAINDAFSILVLSNDYEYLSFNFSDISYCLSDAYVNLERMEDNEYLGNFEIHFDKNKFLELILKKRNDLILNGINKNGKNISNFDTIVKIENFQKWLTIESKLNQSNLPYAIIGMDQSMAIVKISSNNSDENIIEILDKSDLKISLEDNKYYLNIKDK